ncbi:DEAD-box ATP-dependent RNA helicase 50 [Gastrolobium bilobum]|uniref:DEAD-box ATP-dependent RNA helicase 50 n=1 Tax=Gastrolobium bilobum TaxID=150636 RepID=UPI002AAF3692|nr:DEAD-box ATP-dependent RNA helicase 50 [Gastrolobium bilobum]
MVVGQVPLPSSKLVLKLKSNGLRGGYGHGYSLTLTPSPTHILSSSSSSSFSLSASANEHTTTSNNGGNLHSTLDNDSSSNSPSKLSSNFGRLKAQRVKALIHRAKEQKRSVDDNLVVKRAPFSKRIDIEDENPDVTNKASSGSGSGARRSPSHSSGWGYSPPKPQTQKKEQRKQLPDNNFFSLKSFKDIGYSDYIIQSLKKQSLTRPSHVQAMAFKPVVGGKTCVVADQSGSGKTLAYLAPIVQRLRQEELEGLSKSSPQAPRVVIMAPTAELASQVLNNCRSLSKSGVPFKSMVVTGGFKQKTQLENLQQGVDVLIATPGRFLLLIKEGFLQLTNLRCAVLDEVDILFGDEDFEGALQCLINSSPVDTQYLFVTATLPKNVYSKLVELFPDCEMIMGPSMHRISSRLEEIIVDCSGEDGQEKTPDTAFLNKKDALLQLMEESPVPRTIVFCNKIETCRKVENSLKRIDKKGTRIQVLPFHAAMTQESRLASMGEFTHSPSKEVSQFMVCTDRASRGIDFARVDHVILFDFPRDPSEYVRRVGRTARGASGKGKAYIFVVGKQVSLARKIMERNQKGHPLHDVPSAYELMR